MKTLQCIAVVILLFLQGINLPAQSFQVKNYKMSVSGTSTLHDWVSNVETIDCSGAYVQKNGSLSAINNVVLKIKVAGIKSTKGKTMDNKTYEAFNYEKNPYITFVLKSEKIDNAASTIILKGDLTMAGVTKAVDLTVKYKLFPNGDLQITGSKNLTMTDFGMEPPTAMMGTIKVGDQVAVSFDMILTSNTKI